MNRSQIGIQGSQENFLRGKAMTRTLMIVAVVVGGIGFAAPGAKADPPSWGIQVGFGSGGLQIGAVVQTNHLRFAANTGIPIRGVRHVRSVRHARSVRHVRPVPHVSPVRHGGFVSHRGGPRRAVHVHARMPILKKVWVPAVYKQVLVGYTVTHCPIYRKVLVNCGHYNTVVTGYRCSICGRSL
jgi:hypothetical protein